MRIGTTRKRLAAGIALAAVAALVASTGLAAQGRGGPGAFGGALRHLDLTDEQRESIRGAVREHRESGAAVQRELRAALRELRAATTAEVVNETTIRALAAAAAPLQADAAVLRAQLSELRENARENMRSRRPGRRGRRGAGD